MPPTPSSSTTKPTKSRTTSTPGRAGQHLADAAPSPTQTELSNLDLHLVRVVGGRSAWRRAIGGQDVGAALAIEAIRSRIVPCPLLDRNHPQRDPASDLGRQDRGTDLVKILTFWPSVMPRVAASSGWIHTVSGSTRAR
jgi:hypothetical protein